MERPEYLSEKEAQSLSFSDFTRAARRTLQEVYDRKSHLLENPPAATTLFLTLADRRWLRGMKIKVDD